MSWVSSRVRFVLLQIFSNLPSRTHTHTQFPVATVALEEAERVWKWQVIILISGWVMEEKRKKKDWLIWQVKEKQRVQYDTPH